MQTGTQLAPFFQQFSKEQLYKGYIDSAEGLKELRDKALATGKKANGKTADFWDEQYKIYLKIAENYK